MISLVQRQRNWNKDKKEEKGSWTEMEEKVIDAAYGEVFHELRKAAGLSLGLFERIGVSQGALSKFENGKTLLRLDKLEAALEELHMSMGEYERMVKKFQPDLFQELMGQVDRAYWRGDQTSLLQIYKESKSYGQPFITWAAKNSLYGYLSPKERFKLREYLIDKFTWTYFDLMGLSLTIDQLPSFLGTSILRDFWKGDSPYQRTTRYRKLLIQAGHRFSRSLIRQGEREKAKQLLESLDLMIQERDLEERMVQKFIAGYYHYNFINLDRGYQTMDRMIRLFRVLKSPLLATHYGRLLADIHLFPDE